MVYKLLGLILLLGMIGCGDKAAVVQQLTTEFFTVDFNPEKIDTLYVQYNGTSMYNTRSNLLNQAQQLFVKMDAVPRDYRVGVITADGVYNPGKLRGPVITKNVGTLSDRVDLFNSILSQIINLEVGPHDQGMYAALTALNSTFTPRIGVPLVMIFVSDSDDHSATPSIDAAHYFHDQYLALKNGKPELLKIYSINYVSGGDRCATHDSADIDSPGFEDRYFKLAQLTAGSGETVTADLCGSFATPITFSGLRLSQLPKAFHLTNHPLASSIQVSIVRASTGEVFQQTWHYDSVENAIVFDQALPEGTTIQVSFQKG